MQSPDLILIVSTNLLWFLVSACLLGLLVARWSPPASRRRDRQPHRRARPLLAFAEDAGARPEPDEDSVVTAPLAVVLASPLRPLPPFPSHARHVAAAPCGVPGLRRGSPRWRSAVLASRAWLAAPVGSSRAQWPTTATPRHAAARSRYRAPAASPRHARVRVRPRPRAWVQGRLRVLAPAAALGMFLAAAAAGASLPAAGPGIPQPGAAVGAEAIRLNARPGPGTGAGAPQTIIGRVRARQTAGGHAAAGRAGRPSARPAGELATHRTGPSVSIGASLSAARARMAAVRDVLSWLRRLRSGDAPDARSAQERTLAASLGRELSRLRLTIARLERDLEAAARPQLSDRATLMAASTSQPASPVAAQTSPAPVPADSPGTAGGVTGGGPAGGGAAAVAYAQAQLGKPYVWGGAGPYGYDCSGLVMMAWQAAGIRLPHYTVSQWDDTYHISADQLQPGDLVFSNGFGHVQLYVGHGEVIQAPHTGAVVSYAPLPPPGDVDGYASVPVRL